jgi:hypothetical protein
MVSVVKVLGVMTSLLKKKRSVCEYEIQTERRMIQILYFSLAQGY